MNKQRLSILILSIIGIIAIITPYAILNSFVPGIGNVNFYCYNNADGWAMFILSVICFRTYAKVSLGYFSC